MYSRVRGTNHKLNRRNKMLNSKEFYELMAQFEKDMKYGQLKREEKKMWPRKVYYCNGEVNNLFKIYMLGYQNAKCLARLGEFD